MSKKTTHSVFFSPTGTSRSIVQAMSRGIGRESETVLDITCAIPSSTPAFSEEDLVVVGVPVYGGRLPVTATERLKSLKGSNTPVVAVVVYGNRAYGDALVELCDLCVEQGFRLVGASAFIGQHTFSSAEKPIALHRPDQQDVSEAEAFGRQIKEQAPDAVLDRLSLPGNRPYKAAMQPGVAATDTDMATCTQCGACAARCPVQCITMVDGKPQTAPDGCIWCMACVQSCPTGARRIVLPKIDEIAERLYTNCQARLNPDLFYPQGA